MTPRSTWKPLAKGALTLVPGVYRALGNRKQYGTIDPDYCYAVWTRHWLRARRHQEPDLGCVAELGPGASIGIGLAALLCGAERYVALDLVEMADTERNLQVFESLVELVRRRAPIPGKERFPRLEPPLADDELPPIDVDRTLAPERLDRIRRELRTPSSTANSLVRYITPWLDASAIDAGSVTFLYSQAVLEHVDDLPVTYQAMMSWMRPGALMSHTIDYTDHRLTGRWNGHWQYSPAAWAIVRGKRPYLLNREPHGTHRLLIEETGFEVVEEERMLDQEGLDRDALAIRYRNIPELDLHTRSAYVIARKPV